MDHENPICSCEISATLLVFGIFFLVFREGAPLLFGEGGFDLIKFLTSPEWYPFRIPIHGMEYQHRF